MAKTVETLDFSAIYLTGHLLSKIIATITVDADQFVLSDILTFINRPLIIFTRHSKYCKIEKLLYFSRLPNLNTNL